MNNDVIYFQVIPHNSPTPSHDGYYKNVINNPNSDVHVIGVAAKLLGYGVDPNKLKIFSHFRPAYNLFIVDFQYIKLKCFIFSEEVCDKFRKAPYVLTQKIDSCENLSVEIYRNGIPVWKSSNLFKNTKENYSDNITFLSQIKRAIVHYGLDTNYPLDFQNQIDKIINCLNKRKLITCEN